jgi:hypothetical protein
MGCFVVVGAHLLFGIIASPLLTLWRFLGPSSAVGLGDFGFEANQLFVLAYLLSLGGFFTWFVTFPAGILAAYCVEVLGWLREDAQIRRQREQVAGDQSEVVE